MSGWGTNGNANRIKDTYIKGFLDISGGPLIVEKTSSLQVMAHDSDNPVIEFKSEYFTVNTTSAVDISYSALAAIGFLGVSFENSSADITNRVKYITTGETGVDPNKVFYTKIGNDDEKSDLQVYGFIKGHYGLEVDGDVSFNDNLFVAGDSSMNNNLSVGGNLYVAKRSVFSLDVSMNGNLSVNNDLSLNGNLYVAKKSFFGGDVSMNANLYVNNDLSLNGNLYVVKRSLFTLDVSMNGNVKLGSGSRSVSVNKDISSAFALDVSGLTVLRNTLYVGSDVSMNGNLYVNNDLSLNGNLYVAKRGLFTLDVSMNGNVKLGSGSRSVAINKDISSSFALDVSGLTVLRNTLYVGSDVSMNTNLYVNNDLSLNGNLYVVKRGLFTLDVSMSQNLDIGSGSSSVAINKDISSSFALDVSGLTVLRNTLYVGSDVSMNTNLYVNNDLSLNGNLYVVKRGLFTLDVSMNGNVKLGSGSRSVAINKDISSSFALDVSGLTVLRNTLYVGSDVSMNGNLYVNNDLSLNGNLYVVKRGLFTLDVSMSQNLDIGSGSSSVAINKDISSAFALDVSGLTVLRNTLYVGSDVSMNTNLYVNNDLSLNGNLYVVKRGLFTLDVSMNGNVKLGSGSRSVAINKDISSSFALDVSGLTVLRNTLYVGSDVSMNGNLYVNNDLSLNGNLYVVKRGLFTLDVSMSQNLDIGSGSSSVAINKDISSAFALDVSGLTVLRNTLYVGSDVSMNGNLYVNNDLSLNGNLYVVKRGLFTLDVSMNGNVKLGSGSRSVAINKDISSSFALDVSGLTVLRNTLYVGSDVSMNGNLYVNNDLSLNGNLYVSKRSLFTLDVSMSQNLDIGSGSSSVSINKDISSAFALDVSGLTVLRNTLYVGSDVSMNGNLYVNNDLSLNGNLYVVKRGLFTLDVSMSQNLDIGSGSSSVSINKDISSAFALDVSGLTVLRNTLFVGGDASMNGNLSVGNDLSLNGNLYVVKRSVFTLDVSMLSNLDVGTGSSSVAINKDISSAFALDVSGVSQFRGNMDVAGTFTVNGAPVSAGGGSLTGNVQVGTNSGFVTIDKPQFYSDPSLTIYYDFDTLSYTGTTIANKGNGGAGFTATLQGTTAGMIDSSEKKWGTASLKQNTAVSNDGMTINSTIPVSNTFSVSLWVKKSGNTTIDRLFEFSNVASGTSENETIALNVNTSGKLVPIITNVAAPAVTLSNNYIFDYNIGNNIWNNIVWILASGKSYIYINGTICQIDTVNTITNLTNRTYGYIARTNNTTGYAIENGNIDDFRYYRDKALSYAEIYQLSTNNFYTLDICGGFLANGSSVIYEASGSVATANRGTLTLLHGDASGSSSIMFKSVNDPTDYGYIEYDENVTGSTGYHYGLMTIGIENDAGSNTAQADRISLFASGGNGFVGVNTKTPLYSLDVSGTLNTNADASINGVSVGRGGGNAATNTALGYQALKSNTTGTHNTSIGYNAHAGNAAGSFNTTIGTNSLQYNSGHNNSVLGYNSLVSGNNASYNVAVGSGVLQACSGQYNTAIGINSGGNNATTADNNTFLGANTTVSATTWTNSTAVGYNAIITASNQVQLGNASCTAQATSFNATSDYREKANVLDLNETFTVDTLRPVVYDFKPLGKKHIGFIAHEVQEFYPYLVSGEKDGPASQSMNYNGFIGILTKEIQVLKKKVAEQEQRIQALEKMVLDLINK